MPSGGAPRLPKSPTCRKSWPATGRPFSNSKPSGRRTRAILETSVSGVGAGCLPSLPSGIACADYRNGKVALDLDALTGCLASPACFVTQTTSGLIIGMLLFLVAVGLTLIFGVLKVVNFTHGAFYMFGAYFAM